MAGEYLIRFLSIKAIAWGIRPSAARVYDTKITFIGVIHHELSHLLLAILTGAKVEDVQLFSVFQKDKLLGYVSYRPRGPALLRGIQKILISIAPTVLGTITSFAGIYWLVSRWIASGTAMFLDWRVWVLAIVISHVVYHSCPSKEDIRAMAVPITITLVLSLFSPPFTYMAMATEYTAAMFLVMAATAVPVFVVSVISRIVRKFVK